MHRPSLLPSSLSPSKFHLVMKLNRLCAKSLNAALLSDAPAFTHDLPPAASRPARWLATLIVLAFLGCQPREGRAEIPEPDNVLWGIVTLAGQPVTAAQTNIVIEARKTASGAVVSSYRMGDAPAYGNAYSLRVPLEAFLPLTDTNASRVGGLIYLSVRDEFGVRISRNSSIPNRGKVTRLDFVELDTDGDGLPDDWERRYFDSPTAANPGDDSDRDGRDNRDEFVGGTDPTRPDGRHPADAAPADNAITFAEFADYTDAWFFGSSWSTSPTNIPIAYATRAAFLWIAGESYVFTNVPPRTNAPLWWVNTIPIPGYTNTGSSLTSTLPPTLHQADVLNVNLLVAPSDAILAHAVEDAVPVGWTVIEISHGGHFDERNQKVKWGPFLDNGQRELSYTVRSPATNGSFTFAAQASFDGLNLPTTVRRAVELTNANSVQLVFAASRLDGQGPLFTVRGAPLTRYDVEISTNLVTWSPLRSVVTDSAGLSPFRPPAPLVANGAYFRARVP